jgi:hypothetical protein
MEMIIFPLSLLGLLFLGSVAPIMTIVVVAGMMLPLAFGVMLATGPSEPGKLTLGGAIFLYGVVGGIALITALGIIVSLIYVIAHPPAGW